MKTAEIIENMCTEMGITKADLAKKMGMLPSSLYRKLARESTTLEELQTCLSVMDVRLSYELEYPTGHVHEARISHEILLRRLDVMRKMQEALEASLALQKKSLRELRTSLHNAVGYVELAMNHPDDSSEYIKRLNPVLNAMDQTLACALGDPIETETKRDVAVDPAVLAGRRVLIVDDNQLNREIMKAVLVDKGLAVDEASNGREASAVVSREMPGYYHVILMDIEMPVMDGFAATMAIRSLPNRLRANVPIIALTANATTEFREKAAAVGMDDFLVKPANSERLLAAIAGLV